MLTQIRDPRLDSVTLTAVDVASDFSFADVHYTFLCAEKEFADQLRTTQHALDKAGGFLRAKLSRSLRLRVTPKLRFHYDESVRRGHILSKLIDDACNDDKLIPDHSPHPEP